MNFDHVILSNSDTIILPIPSDIQNADIDEMQEKLAAIAPYNSVLLIDNKITVVK